MDELELGQATIVYDDPEDGTIDETVANEELVYVRDHWAINAGTDDEDNDVMRQIPRDRVHYVERNVERFEEQARTVRHRVESVARDLQRKLPVDLGTRDDRRSRRRHDGSDDDHGSGDDHGSDDDDGQEIPVESGREE